MLSRLRRTLLPIALARSCSPMFHVKQPPALDRFVELLLTWQRTTNLIAPSTVPRLWTPHCRLAAASRSRARCASLGDLGSGAGFGLAIACALTDCPGASFICGKQREKSCLPARGTAGHRRPGRGAMRCGSKISWIASGIGPTRRRRGRRHRYGKLYDQSAPVAWAGNARAVPEGTRC